MLTIHEPHLIVNSWSPGVLNSGGLCLLVKLQSKCSIEVFEADYGIGNAFLNGPESFGIF